VQDLKDFAQITIEKKAEEGDRSGCPASSGSSHMRIIFSATEKFAI